jgi:hypothetical protein
VEVRKFMQAGNPTAVGITIGSIAPISETNNQPEVMRIIFAFDATVVRRMRQHKMRPFFSYNWVMSLSQAHKILLRTPNQQNGILLLVLNNILCAWEFSHLHLSCRPSSAVYTFEC